MATPALTASTRFFRPGISKCYYIPTIAATNLTPTRAEMNAGTDLSAEIADISGWSVTSSFIDTPDYSTQFTGKITGRTEADDSSITFYESQNSVDVRTVLPRNTTGYIMWLDGGDVAGQKADVFPVKVGSNAKQRTTDDEAAMIEVQFAVTRTPAENVTIPS